MNKTIEHERKVTLAGKEEDVMPENSTLLDNWDLLLLEHGAKSSYTGQGDYEEYLMADY